MSNVESQMSNKCRRGKVEDKRFVIRYSSFFRHLIFVIRDRPSVLTQFADFLYPVEFD